MHRTKFKKENTQIITDNNSKIKQARIKVHGYRTPLDEIYPPTKFRNHSEHSFEDMPRTKFKYENKQRAITQKLSKQELRFLCTALPVDKIYPPTKVHN